jgi:hypothetical protein
MKYQLYNHLHNNNHHQHIKEKYLECLDYLKASWEMLV